MAFEATPQRAIRLTGITANTTTVIPAGYQIIGLAIKNTTANAVTGGVKIGTTSGAIDVAVAIAVGASVTIGVPPATILLSLWAADQTLYIQTVTLWNSANLSITFLLAKMI